MKFNNSIVSNLKYDLPSGVVVFFVALPLCLGISLASGAPLFAGIISGIVGGIVVGIASKSQVSVSGPAAGLAVIVLGAITSLHSYEAFLLAILFAGFLQIILGLIKAGSVAVYFPNAVIKGMLAAIGVILILKQLPHAVGYDFDYEGDESFAQMDQKNTLSELLDMVNYISPGAVIVAALSFTILIFWESKTIKKTPVLKLLPGSLIAVIAGISLNILFNAYFPALKIKEEHLVNLPFIGDFNSFLGKFTPPDFSQISNPEIYKVAVTIAIVASLESLLSIEATDKLDPYKRITSPNHELIAQGLGNMAAGLIGGLPVTAVIVRSSANIGAGARTKMSTVFHGMLLLTAILFLHKALSLIPLSCLAAVLIMVGYKLAKVKLFKDTYRLGWDQFIPFIVTILGVVFTDLLKGVGMGVFVSVIFILQNNYKSPYVLKRLVIEGKESFFIKLSQNVTFINKGKILSVLQSIPDNSEVLIDGGRATFIDKDVLEIISDFKKSAEFKNIKVTTEEIEEIEKISHH